jgi:hypothetical protein
LTNPGELYGRDHLLLSLLWEAGYKVSWKKAQICQNTIKYLTCCRLSPERKQVVCSIQVPKTHQQLREFLGAMSFC